jgi:hypothetical protein
MAVLFQDFVNVTITNSDQECSCIERSLPRNIKIADLKVMSCTFSPFFFLTFMHVVNIF